MSFRLIDHNMFNLTKKGTSIMAPRGLTLMLLLIMSLLSGCAGTVKHMQEVSTNKVMIGPATGKAAVVFLRPSGMGALVQSSVFEVKANRLQLVGIVAAKTKVVYYVDPGQHLFMVVGENADFMKADLVADRTYYVSVSPRMGLWKARFGLEPIKGNELSSPEFKSSLEECKWVENTAASENWAIANMASIESKRAEYYADWSKVPEEEKQRLSMDDGT